MGYAEKWCPRVNRGRLLSCLFIILSEHRKVRLSMKHPVSVRLVWGCFVCFNGTGGGGGTTVLRAAAQSSVAVSCSFISTLASLLNWITDTCM